MFSLCGLISCPLSKPFEMWRPKPIHSAKQFLDLLKHLPFRMLFDVYKKEFAHEILKLKNNYCVFN